jgi:hypothetical protein
MLILAKIAKQSEALSVLFITVVSKARYIDIKLLIYALLIRNQIRISRQMLFFHKMKQLVCCNE